jgi:2-polyprenyl-3-methyl-5-hydroxy-6-metoxy-1,4-benzoquinol methylase
VYGREKAFGETNRVKRMGYQLLGELHIPGRLRIWHVIKELRRLGFWSRRPLHVLDAGGGEGAFSYYLARRFPEWRVVVADNEPKTLEKGRRIKEGLKLDNLEVAQVDLLNFDHVARYDVVICSDVLEHIVDDQGVMHGLARALKPGGFVILTSPSTPQPKHLPLVAWREKKIGFTPADYGHVREGYSEESLSRVIRDSGLEVEKVRFTFGRFGTFMFDIFFVTGDSRPNPLVFAGLLPFYLGLSALDLALPIGHGAAILGVGRKPPAA